MFHSSSVLVCLVGLDHWKGSSVQPQEMLPFFSCLGHITEEAIMKLAVHLHWIIAHVWPYLVVYIPPSRWLNPYWQFLQWALFVWPCCVGVCGLAFRSLWMTDAVRYNGSLNERAIVLWMYASGPKLVGCMNTWLNGFFHMEGIQLAEVCKYEKKTT